MNIIRAKKKEPKGIMIVIAQIVRVNSQDAW